MMAVVLELLLALVEKICVIVVIAYLITRTKYFMEVRNKRFTLTNRVILILISAFIISNLIREQETAEGQEEEKRQ